MSWGRPKASCRQNKALESQSRLCSSNILHRVALSSLVIITLTIGWYWPEGKDAVVAAPLAQGQQGAGTLAIVGATGAQLYNAPGGEALQLLAAGTVLTAVGRTTDNLWVVVHNSADLAGWVEVSDLVIFGVEQLPVMVEGTIPAAQPTAPGGGQPGASPQATVLLPTPTTTPRPTATPTPTPVPTNTPTPLPTATPTPTPLPTVAVNVGTGGSDDGSQDSLVAVVRGGGASLYDRPGGTPIQQLATGTALTAWGRSSDSMWLVVISSSGVSGWIQVTDVVVFNVQTLPVLDSSAGVPIPPAATVEPTATDVQANQSQESEAEEVLPTDAATEEAASQAAAPPTVEATPLAPTGARGITATVIVTDSRLNIRSGPGTGYRIVGKAEPGDLYEISGRNIEATWIELVLPGTAEGYGWVSAEFVTLSHPILGIPVSERLNDLAPEPTATRVTNSGRGAPTELSGRLVFQSSNGGTIYVYDLASGEVWSLTGGFDPAISPDGSTVAFTRIGGDHGLFLIDIDGSNERRIWNGSEGLRSATWSPDGRWIAFVRQSGSFRCRDVGFGICLPDNPFLQDFPETNIPEFNLSRVDLNGENFRDIPALNSAQAPQWAQDGIVYQASTGIEITTDTPDAETRALVQAPFYQDPNWQPSGNRVLFQAREGSHWEIFVINSDGTGLAALTRPVTALVENLPSNVAPAWSPDGRHIVFLSNRDEENDAGAWRLWVMAADGSNQRPLPIDVPLEYSFANEQAVSWGIAG